MPQTIIRYDHASSTPPANELSLQEHINDSEKHLDSVLPISKGGTGAITPSQARDNLGIGTRTELATIAFGAETPGNPNNDFASKSDLAFPASSSPAVTWNTGWQSAYTSGDKVFRWFAQERIVYLNGFVERISGTGIRVLTLPLGYHPDTSKYFVVVRNNGTTSNVRVDPWGHVEVLTPQTTPSIPICLDGIIFGIQA